MDNAITKTLLVAVVILSTGTHYKITTETYNQIHKAGLDDWINLPYVSATAGFKVSAVMDVVPIDDYETYHPEKARRDTHQPYVRILKEDYKILPIEERHQLMLKGLRKVRPNATLKDVQEIGLPKVKKVKYKTWKEAKAAGVV